MRSAVRTIAFAVSAWLALAPAASAEVRLSLHNGRVTLIAKDATIRQILAEWARVGKTKIVNGDRVPGGPLTLELKDVPEAEALDVLLRTLSGYMAAPRLSLVSADTSVYDSIVVMPTVAAAAPRTGSAAPAAFTSPAFATSEEEPENERPVRPGGATPRPPIFSTFPTPQQGNGAPASARPMLPVVRPGQVSRQPQEPVNNGNESLPPPIVTQAPPAQAAPTATPGGFGGTSAPGMIPPAASQPGQIVQPRPNNE